MGLLKFYSTKDPTDRYPHRYFFIIRSDDNSVKTQGIVDDIYHRRNLPTTHRLANFRSNLYLNQRQSFALSTVRFFYY